jgi:hypothetical protein
MSYGVDSKYVTLSTKGWCGTAVKAMLSHACHKYTWGSTRTAPLTLNFGTRCQWSA